MRVHRLFAIVALLGAAQIGCKAFETSDLDIMEAPGDADSAEGDRASFACDAFPDAAFCDDFDGSAIDEIWDGVSVLPDEEAGVILSDSNVSLSGARSLLAIMNEGSLPETYPAALVTKALSELTGKPSHVEISFDMRVEQFDLQEFAAAMPFQLVLGNGASGLGQLAFLLQSDGEGLRGQLLESRSEADSSWTMSVQHGRRSMHTAGEWAHVQFTFDILNPGGTGNRASFMVDDKSLFDGELLYELHDGEARIELGLPWVYADGATGAWRIRYDNVLIEIEP